jgi:autotransporter-associated beta strand protein
VFSAGSNATGAYTVTVSGSVTASSITFEEGTVTLAGTSTPVLTLSGVGGITINSTINGTTTFGSSLNNVILSLSQNWANNSSQAFNIASGVVASGAARTLTLNGSGSGGTTFSGVLGNGTGTLAITVNTTGGVTTFSNTASTYTGQLTVQSGTLSIDTANNTGSNGELGNSANSVILGGSGSTGTLEYTGGDASSTKKFTMATGGTGVFQVDTAASTLTLGGVIDGSGALTKTGTGTLLLSGANTYSGDTTVAAGTLQVGLATAIPNGAGKGNVIANGTLDTNGFNITINGLSGSGFVDNASGSNDTLTVGNNDASSTFSGVIENTGHHLALTKTGAGTLTLSGANTYVAGTTISGGTLQLGDGGTTGSLLATSAIVDNANLTINRSNAFTQATDLSAVIISGSGSFTQAGSGTTTLSLVNTYTGATTISAGTLNSAGASALGATSGITVNGTGTLLLSASNTINNAATMTLNGNTTNNTLVLSGASEGASTTTGANVGLGALTLQSQSRLDFLQTTSTIVFGKTGTTAFVDASNFKLDIYSYSGDSTPAGNSDHLVFQQDMTGSTGDFEFWNGSSFVGATTSQLGSSGFWEITPLSAVPEPSTWAAGAFALLGLVYFQRRRVSRLLGRAV